jgi:hypothetical protein
MSRQNPEKLVPGIEDTDWELSFVDVAADEEPVDMSWGQLVEGYMFEHSEEDIRITANIEDRTHEYCCMIYFYVDDTMKRCFDCGLRGDWIKNIQKLMKRHPKDNL